MSKNDDETSSKPSANARRKRLVLKKKKAEIKRQKRQEEERFVAGLPHGADIADACFMGYGEYQRQFSHGTERPPFLGRILSYPVEIHGSPGLSSDEKVVYATIFALHRPGDDGVAISQKDIAGLSGLRVSAVNKAIKKLARKDMLLHRRIPGVSSRSVLVYVLPSLSAKRMPTPISGRQVSRATDAEDDLDADQPDSKGELLVESTGVNS